MKSFLPKLLLAIVTLVFSFSPTIAASLALSKIGALDVGTTKISGQWWYTSTNPTLYGTATEDTTVNINIDGTEGTATSDGSGNWQFYSDNLTDGNHQVTVTSNGESFSFSLNIGQDVPEGTGSATIGKGGSLVPTTGSSNLLVYIAISSILILGGGILLITRKNKS